eukprot:scaffold30912_cov40-Phaeocystis_antarctica.AAC.1
MSRTWVRVVARVRARVRVAPMWPPRGAAPAAPAQRAPTAHRARCDPRAGAARTLPHLVLGLGLGTGIGLLGLLGLGVELVRTLPAACTLEEVVEPVDVRLSHEAHLVRVRVRVRASVRGRGRARAR